MAAFYQAWWILPTSFLVWFIPWLILWYYLTTEVWSMTPTFSFISYPGGVSILSESLRFRGHVKLFLIYQGCGSNIGQVFKIWWNKVRANWHCPPGKVRMASGLPKVIHSGILMGSSPPIECREVGQWEMAVSCKSWEWWVWWEKYYIDDGKFVVSFYTSIQFSVPLSCWALSRTLKFQSRFYFLHFFSSF